MNQRRHLQFFVATLVIVIGSSLTFSPQALAAPKLGGACTQAGATTKVSGKTLKCDKKNKKLV
jgi:hypothetical protein